MDDHGLNPKLRHFQGGAFLERNQASSADASVWPSAVRTNRIRRFLPSARRFAQNLILRFPQPCLSTIGPLAACQQGLRLAHDCVINLSAVEWNPRIEPTALVIPFLERPTALSGPSCVARHVSTQRRPALRSA